MIKLEPRQDLLVADTTTRILVDDIHKLFNRMFAVANHMTRHTFRRRDQLTIHNQQAMIEAFEKGFNNHGTTVFSRFFESCLNFGLRSSD